MGSPVIQMELRVYRRPWRLTLQQPHAFLQLKKLEVSYKNMYAYIHKLTSYWVRLCFNNILFIKQKQDFILTLNDEDNLFM